MPIRCVVVTPEKTELDREADSVILPMFDGELGVLPKRSAMIGRLGFGTLKLQTAAGLEKYYVDGGFAQVENDVVNILTARAIPVDMLNAGDAQDALQAAQEMPATTPEESQLRDTALRRARGQIRAAR